MTKAYGKIKDEERLEQSIVAREIVKTIRDYGVSQYQITKIVYLLSLELEDRDLADDIVLAVKHIASPDNNDEDSQESEIIMR